MYYSEKEARSLIIKAGLELVKNNLIARTWGNISARISQDEFIITPSGRAYDTLKEEDLPIVNMNDMSYVGPYKPSGEKGIHAESYKMCDDCMFIIHTHQNYSTAISLLKKEQNLMLVVDYALPSTKFLMDKFVECLSLHKNERLFALERHGIVALGKSYEEAFNMCLDLEKASEEYFNNHHFDHDDAILSKPYLDDYAQMMGFGKKSVEEDAHAIELIKFKNSLAAKVSEKPIPMNPFDVLLQHTVYKLKYSKLKNK